MVGARDHANIKIDAADPKSKATRDRAGISLRNNMGTPEDTTFVDIPGATKPPWPNITRNIKQ